MCTVGTVGTGSFDGNEVKEAAVRIMEGFMALDSVLGRLSRTALVAWTVMLAPGPKPVGIAATANSSALLDLVGVLLRDRFPLLFLEPVESPFAFPFPFRHQICGCGCRGCASKNEGKRGGVRCFS